MNEVETPREKQIRETIEWLLEERETNNDNRKRNAAEKWKMWKKLRPVVQRKCDDLQARDASSKRTRPH